MIFLYQLLSTIVDIRYPNMGINNRTLHFSVERGAKFSENWPWPTFRKHTPCQILRRAYAQDNHEIHTANNQNMSSPIPVLSHDQCKDLMFSLMLMT